MKSIKTYLLQISLVIILIGSAAISFAQTAKIITLKDGSVLKGKVIQLDNGIYTIETSNLGSINIPEVNILSIASPEATKVQQSESNASEKAQLKNQVQKIQGSILSDPGLMMDIQNIIKDEEVQVLLSNPKLLDDVMSYDQEKIRQNDDVQSLMQNPKIQNLMNKIQQKMPAEK